MTLYSILLNKDFFAKPESPTKTKFTMVLVGGVFKMLVLNSDQNDHSQDSRQYYRSFDFGTDFNLDKTYAQQAMDELLEKLNNKK